MPKAKKKTNRPADHEDELDMCEDGNKENAPPINAAQVSSNFQLFLTTRNDTPDIPPDAADILSLINFTTTSGKAEFFEEFSKYIYFPFFSLGF